MSTHPTTDTDDDDAFVPQRDAPLSPNSTTSAAAQRVGQPDTEETIEPDLRVLTA